MISFGQVVSGVTTTVTVASIAVNFLPASTVFDKYPRVKKAYETGISFVILLAVNVRKQLPSLDVHIPGLGFKKE